MKVRVGVVQSSAVFFDLAGGLEKVQHFLQQAADVSCQLVLFPESFLPGYPRGLDFATKIGFRKPEGRDLYLKYWENSLEIPSVPLSQLENWAKKYQVFLVLGITERDPVNRSLYCSMVYISPQAGYLGRHRKLKPTGSERLVWADSQEAAPVAIHSSLARMGGLICWENYLPSARMALYQLGIDLYLAPTADARDTWFASMQHIACEARCFVLSSNQWMRKEDYPPDILEWMNPDEPITCRGGSMIVSPLGEILAGPLIDQEGMLIRDLDMEDVVRARYDFDPVGHYSRPDYFRVHAPNSQIIREKTRKMPPGEGPSQITNE